MENLKIRIQVCACNPAGLCLLNWVLDEREENMAPKTNVTLSDLQQKLDTALLEVTRMCLAVLKASKLSEDERLNNCELVSKFIELLLRNLPVDLPKDGIQMLRNGMIFLITFLMDPPKAENANDGELISTQAAAPVKDAVFLIASLNSGEIKEAIAAERDVLLQDFLRKVNAIKAEVREVYAHFFLDSPSFNSPRMNILGLFDSVIENLKEISINFPMHPILTVQEELVSLRNFLKASNLKGCFILDFRNENKELKDLRTRIVNLAYQEKGTVNSFVYLKSFVWLDMLCLYDLIEEIKHIVADVKRIQDQYMHDINALNAETVSSPIVLLQTNVQRMDEVFVGFEDEINDILDRPTDLNIISIIGMAGIGKTTLARKVYNDSSSKYHFTKCAWCTISQSYNIKKLLLDILNDVTR